MMKLRSLISVLIALLLSASASLAQPAAATTVPDDRFLKLSIRMPALEGNQAAEPVEQPLCVYLPPSYYTTTRRFPVVYFLHGFGGTPERALMRIIEGIEAGMREPGTLEFIVVAPNGRNRLSGSFYVNSPATGRWEDAIVRDTIAYADAHFRTIAAQHARGIAGFSMGGFGALHIALSHPEVFCAVYAVSPGVFAPDGFREAWDSWDDRFKQAYGAAFAPDKDGLTGRLPNFADTDEDIAIRSAWEKGFGNWEARLAQARGTGALLPAIGLEYGQTDKYTWIPKGTVFLSQLLTKQNAPHSLNTHPDGHILDAPLVRKNLVPFFSQHLTTEPAPPAATP